MTHLKINLKTIFVNLGPGPQRRQCVKLEMAAEMSGQRQRLPFWMLFWAYHGRGRDICTKFGTGVKMRSDTME